MMKPFQLYLPLLVTLLVGGLAGCSHETQNLVAVTKNPSETKAPPVVPPPANKEEPQAVLDPAPPPTDDGPTEEEKAKALTFAKNSLECIKRLREAEEKHCVTFEDEILAREIRKTLNFAPDAIITRENLDGLTELSYSGEGLDEKIKSLGGLEHCTKLRKLELPFNDIQDLGPLMSAVENGAFFSDVLNDLPLAALPSKSKQIDFRHRYGPNFKDLANAKIPQNQAFQIPLIDLQSNPLSTPEQTEHNGKIIDVLRKQYHITVKTTE